MREIPATSGTQLVTRNDQENIFLSTFELNIVLKYYFHYSSSTINVKLESDLGMGLKVAVYFTL